MSTAVKTTFTAAEFEKDPDEAKQAAEYGPVFIAGDEANTHVLLTFQEYRRLFPERDISHLLGDAQAAEIEFELPPRLPSEARPLDLD